jgi:dTDP-4-dehydrorhamnose 3,5-epimerase
MQIDKEYRRFVKVQDYKGSPTIEGVRVVEIKNFVTEDGYFTELSRPENGILPEFKSEEFEIKQINYAKSAPDSIKGWHLHEHQEDVWFITPDSKFLVGLFDARDGSATKGTAMRLVLGDGKAHLLYIPRGVAHGYRNLSDKHGYIIYFVNNTFKIQDPDEKRLDWDAIGPEFWELPKG